MDICNAKKEYEIFIKNKDLEEALNLCKEIAESYRKKNYKNSYKDCI
ncbi:MULTISPECIES: hypothetical protein [unclassified Clostridium]